jgi:signal transduction histidine kinase
VSETADDGQRARRPHRPLGAAWTWLATIHLLTGLPLVIVITPVIVVLLTLSVGLLPLFLVGVPLFGITFMVSRLFGAVQRGRFLFTLDERIPSPHEPTTGSLLTRLRERSSRPATWRELGYHMAFVLWGPIVFVLVIGLWTLPTAALTLPIYNWALPNGGAALGFGITVRSLPALLVVVAAGLAMAWLAPYLVRGLAAADVAMARSLLGPPRDAQLVARVGELEESRARVVDSAEAERRRIERDLHDGAQQRLVSLAMNLGRAKARYSEDPDAARAMIDEAHVEAKQALTELRNLARGIHPAVLTDRGLDAALSGLAARSPVPVSVEVDPGLEGSGRLSQTIEAIAYFVVAEALTNIAKHARARSASVVVRRLDESVRIVITDDGVGGADPAAGSGLSGLADRVSGVDGRLWVDSPAGGPTVLTVELPCVS